MRAAKAVADRSWPAPRPSVVHVTTIDMSLRYLLLNQLGSIASDGYEAVGISAPGPDVARKSGSSLICSKKYFCSSSSLFA